MHKLNTTKRREDKQSHQNNTTYSKNPTGACTPISWLTGLALRDVVWATWDAGVKAEAPAARQKARKVEKRAIVGVTVLLFYYVVVPTEIPGTEVGFSKEEIRAHCSSLFQALQAGKNVTLNKIK